MSSVSNLFPSSTSNSLNIKPDKSNKDVYHLIKEFVNEYNEPLINASRYYFIAGIMFSISTSLNNLFEINKKIDDNDNNDTEILFRSISEEDAKKEIEGYITTHPKCRTSQIIDDLQLDPKFIVEILKQLEEEKSIQSKPIESKQ
jgi:hypothetical protein